MNKPITMMFDEEKIASLKDIARQRSMEEHRDVSYTDLIRMAVDASFFVAKGTKRG